MILTTLHERLLRRWRERPLLRTDFKALRQAAENHCMETLRIRQALAQFLGTPATAINRTGPTGDLHLSDVIQTAQQGVQVQTWDALINDQQLVSGNIGIDVIDTTAKG